MAQDKIDDSDKERADLVTLDAIGVLHHMRHALRRGDLDTVERWQKVLERAVRIRQRYADLAEREAKRKPDIVPWPRSPY